jgi:hypothetical protein
MNTQVNYYVTPVQQPGLLSCGMDNTKSFSIVRMVYQAADTEVCIMFKN